MIVNIKVILQLLSKSVAANFHQVVESSSLLHYNFNHDQFVLPVMING